MSISFLLDQNSNVASVGLDGAGGRTRAKGSSWRVARAVVGERDSYHAVAIRVASDGGVEEKINNELRTTTKSFRPLRFERLPSGTGSGNK